MAFWLCKSLRRIKYPEMVGWIFIYLFYLYFHINTDVICTYIDSRYKISNDAFYLDKKIVLSLCSRKQKMEKKCAQETSGDFHACLVSSKPHCEYKKKFMEEFWKKVTFYFSYFHMKTAPPMTNFDFFF